MVANTLLNAENRPGKVVVLEAREICSGASGRNAGHCRPGEHGVVMAMARRSNAAVQR